MSIQIFYLNIFNELFLIILTKYISYHRGSGLLNINPEPNVKITNLKKLTEENCEELVPGDELLEHLLVDLLYLVGDLHGGGVSQPVQHLLVVKQVASKIIENIREREKQQMSSL